MNYDYVVKSLVEEGLKESDLSYNKMLSNNTLPNDISNQGLVMERGMFVRN